MGINAGDRGSVDKSHSQKMFEGREGSLGPLGGIRAPQKELLFFSVPTEAVRKPCWNLSLRLDRMLAIAEPGHSDLVWDSW